MPNVASIFFIFLIDLLNVLKLAKYVQNIQKAYEQTKYMQSRSRALGLKMQQVKLIIYTKVLERSVKQHIKHVSAAMCRFPFNVVILQIQPGLPTTTLNVVVYKPAKQSMIRNLQPYFIKNCHNKIKEKQNNLREAFIHQ